jgi:hypothetical protein
MLCLNSVGLLLDIIDDYETASALRRNRIGATSSQPVR